MKKKKHFLSCCKSVGLKQLISTYITLLFLLIGSTSISQTNACDTIYQSPEKSAVYQDGSISLIKYVQNELFPTISACNTIDEELMTRLKLIFTIDIHGNVIGINFSLENLTHTCQDLLREKILQMPQWTPATINGQPVCSEFYFPISCININ